MNIAIAGRGNPEDHGKLCLDLILEVAIYFTLSNQHALADHYKGVLERARPEGQSEIDFYAPLTRTRYQDYLANTLQLKRTEKTEILYKYRAEAKPMVAPVVEETDQKDEYQALLAYQYPAQAEALPVAIRADDLQND